MDTLTLHQKNSIKKFRSLFRQLSTAEERAMKWTFKASTIRDQIQDLVDANPDIKDRLYRLVDKWTEKADKLSKTLKTYGFGGKF